MTRSELDVLKVALVALREGSDNVCEILLAGLIAGAEAEFSREDAHHDASETDARQ